MERWYAAGYEANSFNSHEGQVVIWAFSGGRFQDDDIPLRNRLGYFEHLLVAGIVIIVLAFPNALIDKSIKLVSFTTEHIAG